ncbi:unnamed protein product [Phaedon cochleariae]|uniref:Cytokine-inducible SH2-containing protein n=1 Tax=Phaedon cochleariae TaxID=80249 RepID=A0A9N9SAT7_PHACE|nr:unnamed protein product [Phaedon cochleariae]
MLGCSTVCPNCTHEFQCCPQPPACCPARRTQLSLGSGGGLVAAPSPQVSPSMPLAFILPPFAPPLHALPSPGEARPDTELERLSDTVRALRQSGWYYEGISYQQSDDLLKGTTVGTFLVRNSSDPKFLFSLSVQTERGPTSVRLFYFNGYFRLDAQPHLQTAMPMFPSVVSLVEHYIEQSRLCKSNAQVWVDQQGKWYSSILLDKPLRRKSEPAGLKHLARLAVHRGLKRSGQPRLAMLPPPHTQLDLPKSLAAYLSEYPFSL